MLFTSKSSTKQFFKLLLPTVNALVCSCSLCYFERRQPSTILENLRNHSRKTKYHQHHPHNQNNCQITTFHPKKHHNQALPLQTIPKSSASTAPSGLHPLEPSFPRKAWAHHLLQPRSVETQRYLERLSQLAERARELPEEECEVGGWECWECGWIDVNMDFALGSWPGKVALFPSHLAMRHT